MNLPMKAKLQSLNIQVGGIPTILSSPSISSSSPSKFCKKWRAVILDDSAVGGYAAQSGDDGEEFLQIKAYSHRGSEPTRGTTIHYDVEDSYPGLIVLSKSAAAGCKFRGFLRATALGPMLQSACSEAEFDITRADKLQIQMKYVWIFNLPEIPTAEGLRALDISFRFYNDYGLSRHALFR